MIDRKLDKEIENHFSNSKSALLLTGARQTGMKSGKDYDRHNALKNVMENAEYAVPEAYVLCNGNLERKGKIVYLPIYMTLFIQKRPKSVQQLYPFSLSHLK